jgi:hypothetical protein
MLHEGHDIEYVIVVRPEKGTRFSPKGFQSHENWHHDDDLGGVGITTLNTSLFLSEESSASIHSFHLFQFERSLHSTWI